jgi:translocation and assembly module TamA
MGVLALLLVPAMAPATVSFEGLPEQATDNARALVDLVDLACDAPDWRLRRAFDLAPGQIRDALEVFGYYSVEVQARLRRDDDCWQADFDVSPGEPVRLRDIRVEVIGGSEAAQAWAALEAGTPLRAGDAFLHADYESFKGRFDRLSRRLGFFDAAFEQSRVDVYPEQLAADVTLVFRAGRRYRIGAVGFDQDVIDESLATRFLRFEPDEYYDATRIAELYEDLQLTGFFELVEVDTRPRPDPYYDVELDIRLKAARPQTFSAGVGFGTDTGIKLRAGYINRLVNTAGHQWEARGDVSRVIQEAGVSYRLPLEDPRSEWLSFDLGYKREDNESALSQEVKFGVKQLKRRPGGWLETRFVDLGYEKFEVGLDDGETFLPVPGLSWTHTALGEGARPLRGHRVNFRISGTLEALGANTQFLQADVYGKLVLPLWSGARFLVRGELGATIKDELSTLPASVRYFAGGDTSVRGYDYKTLGPTDEFGLVVGGSNLLVGSIEVEQRLFGNWAVAAFSDAGNAFEDFDDFKVEVGVGAGLRWFSPLGPIRVDIAVPLDDDAPDDYRLHITLGPDL